MAQFPPIRLRFRKYCQLFLLLIITLSICLSLLGAVPSGLTSPSARVSRKPPGSNTPSTPLGGSNGPTSNESDVDQMARLSLPEVGHDTSPPLRDMAQVPPNDVEFGQSTTSQQAMTARDTDSGAVLVSAGISPDTNG